MVDSRQESIRSLGMKIARGEGSARHASVPTVFERGLSAPDSRGQTVARGLSASEAEEGAWTVVGEERQVSSR